MVEEILHDILYVKLQEHMPFLS